MVCLWVWPCDCELVFIILGFGFGVLLWVWFSELMNFDCGFCYLALIYSAAFVVGRACDVFVFELLA